MVLKPRRTRYVVLKRPTQPDGTGIGWEMGCVNFSDLFLPKLAFCSQENFSQNGTASEVSVKKFEQIFFFVGRVKRYTKIEEFIFCRILFLGPSF